MKKSFALLVLLVAVGPTSAQDPVGYRFDEVKRKVTLNAQAAKVGLQAKGGDRVQTGWLSYALIASEPYKAKFEIFGSTDVKLAGDAPGVILSLERGRLNAIFDKITGNEPRVVKTPGALLAVRGTKYGVEVDASGDTNVEVFEGVVEVRSDLAPLPLLVHAGEAAGFSRRNPPSLHPVKPDARMTPPKGDHAPHDGDDHHRPDFPQGGQGQGHPPQGNPPPAMPPMPQPKTQPPPPPPSGRP